MTKRIGSVLLASAVVLIACGPTAEEAARDFLPVYCEKIKECAPATLAE